MEFWQLILLAIVQGITEFLPVSSSGHIVALATVLDVNALALDELNIALHLGTLLAICFVYREQIKALCGVDRRLVLPIIVGSIPAGIVGGVLVVSGLNETLQRVDIAGAMLIITGLFLWFGSRRESDPDLETCATETQSKSDVSITKVVIIGTFQALAIVPGLSRSGLTIVVAQRLGMEAKLATRFSFFLAIPIISGASLITIWKEIRGSDGIVKELAPQQTPNLYLLLVGVVVSGLVGLFTLRWLIRVIERGKFHRFAFWCIPLGILLLIYSLYG